MLRKVLFILFILPVLVFGQCTCDFILPMTFEATAGVEVIFYGKVIDVDSDCSEESEVTFEIIEQYKSSLEKEQEVIYICGTECGMSFMKDEEWIIYGAKNNAQEVLVDLCSRSRRFIAKSEEDFYQGLLGSTFKQELDFLRTNFKVNETFEGGLKERKYERLNPEYIPYLLGGGLVFVLLGLGVFKLMDKKKK